MTKFKFLLSILTIIGINSYSQSENPEFKIEVNDYQTDSAEYKQVDITVTNSTGVSQVLWIDYKNRDSMNTHDRINEYFYARKGDFTLSSLLYEELANELPTHLYLTFYKILNPNDQFVFTLLIKGPFDNLIEFIDIFKEQIVIVKSNESRRLPPIEDLEKYNFKGKSITMTEEMIK